MNIHLAMIRGVRCHRGEGIDGSGVVMAAGFGGGEGMHWRDVWSSENQTVISMTIPIDPGICYICHICYENQTVISLR